MAGSTSNARPHVPAPTLLSQVLVPIRNPTLQVALQVAIGIAFLALLAQVRFQVGPVPITGQTLGVLLLGAAYGSTLGVATVTGYLLAGGLGLAVFTGGEAGWATLAGPTGGYLLGFPFAAALVGALAARGWDREPLWAAGAMVAGNLVIYAFGLAWLSRLAPDLPTTLAWGLWPFLAGDLVKVVAAAALLPTAWRLSGRS